MTARGWGILIAAFFTVSIAYAIRYGYGILLPGMLESLAITKTEAGLISASYFFAYTIFSPILGFLSDRFDPRLMLSVFPALLALGALLMAYVTTVNGAALAFGLAGLGHAACWAPVVSLVQQWVDDRYRGTVLSITTMGSGIGILGWSVWLPIVAGGAQYRIGWIQMAIFGFCVAGLNYCLMRSPRSEENTYHDQAGVAEKDSIDWIKLLISSKIWLIGISYACIGFTVLVPFTFLNVYATQELQLSFATATSFFSVIAFAGLIGKLILGVLSDKWGRITVMMACGILLGSGCWGVAYLSELWLKFCCVGCIGLGFGAVWPMYAAAAIDYFPKSIAGSVIGVWTVFLGVGSILSPVICGWTIDFFGNFAWTFNLGLAGGLAAAVCLVPLLDCFHTGSVTIAPERREICGR